MGDSPRQHGRVHCNRSSASHVDDGVDAGCAVGGAGCNHFQNHGGGFEAGPGLPRLPCLSFRDQARTAALTADFDDLSVGGTPFEALAKTLTTQLTEALRQ